MSFTNIKMSPAVEGQSLVPRDAESWRRCILALRMTCVAYGMPEDTTDEEYVMNQETLRELGVADPTSLKVELTGSAEFVMVSTPDTFFLAVQGTSFKQVCDLAADVDISWVPDENSVVLHDGFEDYACRIYRRISELDPLELRKATRLYISGHSLGGAVAVVLSYLFRHSRGPPLVPADCVVEVATVAAPRSVSFHELGRKATRFHRSRPQSARTPQITTWVEECRLHRHFVHKDDLVPRSPLPMLKFTGQVYVIERNTNRSGRFTLHACPDNQLPPLPLAARLLTRLGSHLLRGYLVELIQIGADTVRYFEAGGAPM